MLVWRGDRRVSTRAAVCRVSHPDLVTVHLESVATRVDDSLLFFVHHHHLSYVRNPHSAHPEGHGGRTSLGNIAGIFKQAGRR